MVKRLAAAGGGAHEHLEVLDRSRLAHELVERERAQGLVAAVLGLGLHGDDALGLGHRASAFSAWRMSAASSASSPSARSAAAAAWRASLSP